MNKIKESSQIKGFPLEIPGVNRVDFAKFLVDSGRIYGVEIGVYLAEFSKVLCEAGLMVWGIDPWCEYGDFKHPKGNERLEEQYQTVLSKMNSYNNFSTIRATSMDALKEFRDESLDFIYIDGNHGFKYVAEDLWEWSKKVKKGGIIAGHDYSAPPGAGDKYTYHVKHAVEGFAKATGIESFYVLGGDEYKTYFWIKQ